MVGTPCGPVSLEQVLAAQRPDGTWGRSEALTARIVPTIFAARSLQESAAPGGDPALDRALDVLADRAVVQGGAAIRGTRDSVLSCYTGMLALLLLRSGRVGQATPMIEWILRFQPITFGDRTYHRPKAHWDDYLAHRYGGCMARTTCVLGLIPTIYALAEARRTLAVDTSAQERAFGDLLTERRLMFGRGGKIMPLAGRTKADAQGTRWLAPAFPLDYVVDLVALAHVAREVGLPWDAMPEAAELIQSWELQNGGWPMLSARRIEHAYRPDPVARDRRSDIITRRVEALGLPSTYS